MYDGVEYNSKSYPTKGTSSSGSKLEPYQKNEFWEEIINSVSANSSPAGKKVWSDFMDKIRKEEKERKPIQWIRKKKENEKK